MNTNKKKMKNTEKNIETSNQNQSPRQDLLGMYSEVMRLMEERLLSKGLITKENLEKCRKKERNTDNNIEVIFFRRRN